MSISINKTGDNTFYNDEHSNSNIINEMSERMDGICRALLVPYNEFRVEPIFRNLCEYISQYNRILYAPISNMIYDVYERHEDPKEIDDIIGNMMSNVDALREYAYCQDEGNTLEDAKKVVIKIWDHINLANQQYKTLKESEAEYKERFNRSIEPIKENITKDMSAQLLSMVGIFTALAFLVFGGITSLGNIFSNETLPVLKLMMIGCIWGLCILNVVFVFLFCVGKMTKLNFKSTDNPSASIFKKYPIVWWSNIIAIDILMISSWLYYFSIKNEETKLDEFIEAKPTAALIAGLIIIAVVIFRVTKKLLTETFHSGEYDD